MPYISQDDRQAAKSICGCDSLAKLCYHIVNDILRYIKWKERVRWQDYAEILGMLESIKLELYRRRVADHEDVAIERNGDIFDG